MVYSLQFIGKFWLWELRVTDRDNGCRIRFYRTRDGAESVIARYRRMLAAQGGN